MRKHQHTPSTVMSALCVRQRAPQLLAPRWSGVELGQLKGVARKWPVSSSLRSSSAEAATSAVTASSLPETASTNSPVHHTKSLASRDTPACTSAVTANAWPARTAWNSGTRASGSNPAALLARPPCCGVAPPSRKCLHRAHRRHLGVYTAPVRMDLPTYLN
jgi:hypothetical protein